jgi:hypothetical protein
VRSTFLDPSCRSAGADRARYIPFQALVTKASQSLLGSALIYQSTDLDLFSYTGVLPTSGSTLLCIKDHQARTPIASLTFSAENALTQANVSRFVQLDAGNFKEVMKNTRGSIVVLAGLTTSDERKLKDNVAVLRDVATAWRKGGRKFEQGVIFAWMDGNKWGKWLKQNYGCVSLAARAIGYAYQKLTIVRILVAARMSRSAMPQVVVADPIVSLTLSIIGRSGRSLTRELSLQSCRNRSTTTSRSRLRSSSSRATRSFRRSRASSRRRSNPRQLRAGPTDSRGRCRSSSASGV